MADTRGELLQGTLEMLVLKTLALEPMHGWGIAHRIEAMSGNVFLVTQGSLYPALIRMKRRGWLRTAWRVTENNRRARYYELTRAGVAQLETSRDSWNRASSAINGIHECPLRTGGAVSIVTDLMERLRALLFRRREERELAEELGTHTDMEAEHQRRQGLTAAEAQRRSLVALGGMERVKEDVRDARGVRLLEESAGDVRYALRTLARSPGFAAVVILTLAIGIGGTTAVFSAVDAVLLQPLPYQESGRLARLYGADALGGGSHGFVSPVHYLAYRSELQSVEAVAAMYIYSETGADIGQGGDVHRIRLLPTSANYFDVVRVQPALGRPYQPQDENGTGIEDEIDAAPLVVLSHLTWEDRVSRRCRRHRPDHRDERQGVHRCRRDAGRIQGSDRRRD